jgi:hypothetical protein
MSLINDALKRARETQQKNPPSGAPPLPPVESPARGGNSWILIVAAVLFLAAACLFIGQALFGRKDAPVAAVKAPVVPVLPPAGAAPVQAPAPKALPPPATNTNPPPPQVAAVEQPPRIQGIIFNAARPLAIVNGAVVNVGDRVADFQVKQILKSSIVFQCPDGSLKTVKLGE